MPSSSHYTFKTSFDLPQELELLFPETRRALYYSYLRNNLEYRSKLFGILHSARNLQIYKHRMRVCCYFFFIYSNYRENNGDLFLERSESAQ